MKLRLKGKSGKKFKIQRKILGLWIPVSKFNCYDAAHNRMNTMKEKYYKS